MKFRPARHEYIHWLLTTRDLSPHTIRAYEGDLMALERYLGAEVSVRGIDQECLVAFVGQQQNAGLASRTLRRRASGIRGFCRWLHARRLLDADPWIGTTIHVGRRQTLPRALPSHELDQLLRSLCVAAAVDLAPPASDTLPRPHDATTLLAVALMLATGLRVSEVTGLRSCDIDLPSRSLRALGKGRRERDVFLTNEWITTLTRSYLSTRAQFQVQHDHLLFSRSKTPLTAEALRVRILKAGRVAGLQRRVTPHMLRHTAATQLIEAGVDIRCIQRLLGHSSLATTEQYTHVSDQMLRRVVSDADVLGRSFQRR